jgi:hypothetical protein
MRGVRRAIAILAILAAGGATAFAAQRGMPEDIGGVPEEKEFKEDAIQLPAFPPDAGLIEFRLRGPSRNRFFIDRDSLSLGEDRVVRYTMVIKTPGGATNVSYEGMRCKTSEYKVYAYGTTNGTWAAAREAKWQPVGATEANYRYGLWVDYLCNSESVRGRNVADLVANLQGRAPYRSNTTKH